MQIAAKRSEAIRVLSAVLCRVLSAVLRRVLSAVLCRVLSAVLCRVLSAVLCRVLCVLGVWSQLQPATTSARRPGER
jgi:hypothetical protein